MAKIKKMTSSTKDPIQGIVNWYFETSAQENACTTTND